MERTAYDILGVSRTAPAEVMKAAKTALAKIYHPDNGSDPDAEAMTQVNEAYDILTDPERRSIHDSFHAAGGSDGAPAGDTGPGWGDDPVAPDSGNEGWGDESPETDTGASTAAEGPWETYSSPPSPPPVAATHIQAQTPLQQGWTSVATSQRNPGWPPTAKPTVNPGTRPGRDLPLRGERRIGGVLRPR